MVTKLVFPILFCLSVYYTNGQTAQVINIDWTLSETSLVISYDLRSEVPNQTYEVILTLYSNNKKIVASNGISGAIGKGIFPGEKLNIYWQYKQDGLQQSDLQDLDISIQAVSKNNGEETKSVFQDLEDLLYFTPGISANTLEKGAIELNSINARFYNQDIFNFTGPPPYRKLEEQQSSFNTTLRVMYGLSKQKNIDVGLQIDYTSFTIEDANFSISKMGPMIRWRPFGAISESLDLTLQNTVRFVLADPDNISSSQAEFNNFLILTKYFLDINVLLQLNAGVNLDAKSSNESFDRERPLTFPLSFLVGYYPRTNLIFFTGIEYFRTLGTIPWVEEDERYLRQSATTWQVGVQYLINNTFNLFLIPRFKLSDKSGGGAHAIVFGASMVIK